uniref:Uncharacterized protein n=1 Tax=Meloidogyne javanica TaxID=6303 RepID=A0A915MCQ9_MELJA
MEGETPIECSFSTYSKSVQFALDNKELIQEATFIVFIYYFLRKRPSFQEYIRSLNSEKLLARIGGVFGKAKAYNVHLYFPGLLIPEVYLNTKNHALDKLKNPTHLLNVMAEFTNKLKQNTKKKGGKYKKESPIEINHKMHLQKLISLVVDLDYSLEEAFDDSDNNKDEEKLKEKNIEKSLKINKV